MDIVFIQELKAETLVGVYEWERRMPQIVELNLEIGIPDNRAGATDRIADTVDYDAVVRRIREELATKRFRLLEPLAEFVAGMLLDEFKAPWVRVSVAKIGILRNVQRVGISIERGTKV